MPMGHWPSVEVFREKYKMKGKIRCVKHNELRFHCGKNQFKVVLYMSTGKSS